MNRDEHMEWCKQRAREYLDSGDWSQACASMLSDLGKHPETAKSQETCGMLVLLVRDVPSARKFVEGFN